jgi:Double zinc ribbon
MQCPRCQAENEAGARFCEDCGARFCEDCGARFEAACPNCGSPVTPGKKFCRSCGAALTTEPAGRFAGPESYTPKHLAEKILTSKAALEGERKQVMYRARFPGHQAVSREGHRNHDGRGVST